MIHITEIIYNEMEDVIYSTNAYALLKINNR